MDFSVFAFLIAILVSLIAGYLLCWLGQRKPGRNQQHLIEDALAQRLLLQGELKAAQISLGAHEATARAEQQRAERLEGERGRLIAEKQAIEAERTRAETELREERKGSAEKLGLLTGAREQLSDQFKSLASEILEEKSRRFAEQNQKNIGDLLDPLRARILEFQSKVEEAQKESIAGRSELKVHLDELKNLNERLSQDASNLVNALKRDSQAQGNWGEMILERLLEAAGLRKGHEYEVQESFKRDDGKGARLDVVVHLPEGRHIIIDSKLSLLDYTEYCNGTDEKLRAAALSRHLQSVRTHIKGLSERNYQSLEGLNSLDFVFMFVPIEPAFLLAIGNDERLWADAWQKNVLLVSPSTLLFVLRTVAHLWRQEQQKKSVEEIVRRGADLYDKFVGFVEDLRIVGSRMDQAKQTYEDAFNKLSTGRGNLIRQAETLKGLGVKPRKDLPRPLVEVASQEELALVDSAEDSESEAI